MGKIRKFGEFIKEELSPETYRSAANKFRKKGMNTNAGRLDDYAQELEVEDQRIEDKKIMKKFSYLLGYSFDLRRAWTRRLENGLLSDIDYSNPLAPESFSKGWKFSWVDYLKGNEDFPPFFEIYFSDDTKDKATLETYMGLELVPNVDSKGNPIVELRISGGIEDTPRSRGNGCFASDRRSALNMKKMFIDLHKNEELFREFISDSLLEMEFDEISFEDIIINPNNFIIN